MHEVILYYAFQLKSFATYYWLTKLNFYSRLYNSGILSLGFTNFMSENIITNDDEPTGKLLSHNKAIFFLFQVS